MEHLIDREKELQILRRLGRKNIGPRVLGTFNNGRFEQYFEARTLTPEDLRYPDTMKSIAKRMRELHDGIELEKEEREGGPMVLRNWDKWVDRCEQVNSWLDKEIQSDHNDAKAQSEPWRRRGFVCGVPWPVFRRAVDNYRKWLEDTCGGAEEIRRQLVFAHNDVSLNCFFLDWTCAYVADAIRQPPPSRAQVRIAIAPSCKRAQAISRHRLRIRISQHSRLRIRQPLRKSHPTSLITETNTC